MHYACNVHVVGPDENDKRMVNALDRIIIWQTEGGEDMVTYEADPRHAEIIISKMGVTQSTPLASPATKTDVVEHEGEELTTEHPTAFRSTVARVNHLVLDRFGIQDVCNEMNPAMSAPNRWIGRG